jgi:very-short-patch-repair endonuclease
MKFSRYQYNHHDLKERRQLLRKNQTEAEGILWRKIRGKQLGPKFWRQYSVGPYILDFYCPSIRLAVEVDGSQHKENMIYDQERTDYLAARDVTVLRFWNGDVTKDIEEVLEKILEIIDPLLV